MKGYTYMHEHVYIDLSRLKNNDDCRLDCKEETIKEFKKLYKLGVRNIVEVSNIGMGRDISYIQDVAKNSGINIIVSTGFYKEPFLPDFIKEKTVEELADLMTRELIVGIEETGVKAGIIGEIGTSKNSMTEMEEKVFRASTLAHLKTGAPITTHTTLGTNGKRQIEIFKEMGADLSKIIIGHVDLSGNFDYIKELLDLGVNVEFDTIGKTDYLPDEIRADLLAKLIFEGYEDKIVLSMDITRKSHMEYLGGIGYAYLFDIFIPLLHDRGVQKQSIEKMLKKNPRRILEWRRK